MTVSYSNQVPQAMPIVVKRDDKVGGKAASAAAIVGSGFAASTLPQLVTPSILKGMKKANKFDAETTKTLHDAVKQMVVDNGLKEKGVRVRFLAPKERLNLFDLLKNRNTGEKPVRDVIDAMTTDMVRNGNNAFFANKDLKLPTMKFSEFDKILQEEGFSAAFKKLKENSAVYIKKNSVILPKNGLASAGFHEVGHAMNYNLSKVGRFLQTLRPTYKLAPLIGIYAACTRNSKAKDGQELTAGQKTKNFVRNNAGVLAFATALPMLIEEGMATAKGQKYANKVLSKDLAKKVLKGNMTAYLSYLTVGVASGVAAWLATKIKDSIIENKEAKKEEIELARQRAIEAYNAQFAPLNPEPHTLAG